MSGLDAAYADLLDPTKLVAPRDSLRAVDAVREAREAAEGLGLDVNDAAGAAVLWLAARMDAGSNIIDGWREKLAHSVALALLLRVSRGYELLDEAGWMASVALRPFQHLGEAYSRFRSWLDSVAAEFRVGEVRGLRAGLALAAAKAVGTADVGDRRIARLVSAHGRKAPVKPEEVPGALLLARAEGASADGLLRRTPQGLRWVGRKARDLVEKVVPTLDAADGAAPTGAEVVEHRPDPQKLAEEADLLDRIAALGDDIDRSILEGWRRGETDDELGQRVGMSGRAVRKRRRHIRERAARLID